MSRALVLALLTEQHPDLVDREIAEPLEGFDMAVFRLGADLAVRLPRHRGSVASLEAEIPMGRAAGRPMELSHPADRAGGPARRGVSVALGGDVMAAR
jgi:hypothetical protein